MSDCYNVCLKIKFKSNKDKNKAVKELKNIVKTGMGKTTNGIDFRLDELAERGLIPNSWNNLVKIFLADDDGQEVNISNEDGYDRYSNAFNASYGWFGVMYDMFSSVYPYIEDDSCLYVDNDEGSYEMVVEHGKIVEK